MIICETAGVQKLRMEDDAFDQFASNCLRRFFSEDWGDLCDEDKKANADNGTQYRFAKYKGPKDIYIITEHDGSVTTILFPDEY